MSTDDVPCEALFERLATLDPERLLGMFGTLKPSDLTFAAEIAGRRLDSARVVPVLLGLLEHEHRLVREGAVCGLAYHETDEVKEALVGLAKSDPSPGVRRAAQDVLDEGWFISWWAPA